MLVVIYKNKENYTKLNIFFIIILWLNKILIAIIFRNDFESYLYDDTPEDLKSNNNYLDEEVIDPTETEDLYQASSIMSLFNPHRNMDSDKQEINSLIENQEDYLRENGSIIKSSLTNQEMEEKELENSASLLSLLTPQTKIKELELTQTIIDENLKHNLKMRNSILKDFNTSSKLELSSQKNSSLSFGALYSYLFES